MYVHMVYNVRGIYVPEKFNVISDNVIGGNHQVELQDLGLHPASVQTEDKDHNTIAITRPSQPLD